MRGAERQASFFIYNFNPPPARNKIYLLTLDKKQKLI